ncbi:tRNA uridine-5-carboxymethylaminomethyl(34) synthesis enzyme MnmG [Candidatus Acetothermia bacterium]|nr:tRNA uridine-5-carboxymethylaminomethyl(34) synthesis enzyme MnmG [Candidatus Acetothermia bacterium]MCI2427226.1 tRNA uridine-5-carboxymethylaminomethyl(34) synthesis enzyme MnmG [Candidatus Acetothermia bacterium]MCI2428654.1 tRNA uridine-5-carboxymethylaminomethyl(34) synthesis enzyme MnmG [Candidatus Acetothermia bacterium]
MIQQRVDLIVIGAGHAGCEAALAAARLGIKTALLTMDLSQTGKLACNPSIGGPGKSQLVTEIDALGGEMARITDQTMINVRRLNTSKGRAMQVCRAQVDRYRYPATLKKVLEEQDNLYLIAAEVDALINKGSRVVGIRTTSGWELHSQAVIVTVGTFLNGAICYGKTSFPAGRAGEPPALGLTSSLRLLGLKMARFKTGTPPRVDGRSIDFAPLNRQETSAVPLGFSFTTPPRVLSKKFPVYLTETNEKTHSLIRDNLQESANYNGLITGKGPRYCPSIEAKIVKFPHRTSHKVFLEPEGAYSEEYYLQGLYTAFSHAIQVRIVNSIVGLERARITQFGYNIEYEFVDPTQLLPSLEVKEISHLFLAGQINGTTGYEEAAAQGLIAGINAARLISGKQPVVLSRAQAFIGVLLDDLVTKGVDEPYRILPSRAEYRITLREKNADLRLAEIGYQIGLLPESRYEQIQRKEAEIKNAVRTLQRIHISPGDKIDDLLSARRTTPLRQNGSSLYHLLQRPQLTLADLLPLCSLSLSPEVAEEVEIAVKYDGYLQQQTREIARLRRLEKMVIPVDFAWQDLASISHEGKERLTKVKPRSFGQATRIPGLSKADLSLLAIYLKR